MRPVGSLRSIFLGGLTRGLPLHPRASRGTHWASAGWVRWDEAHRGLWPETPSIPASWWQGPAMCCHPRAPSPAWPGFWRGFWSVSVVGQSPCPHPGLPAPWLLTKTPPGRGPRAVDAAAPALQRRAGPLAASLPRCNKLGCIFVTFLVLCTSVRVYLHRNVCRHVWVRACVAKGSLHLRCACEYRGKFQRGAVGWGGALFFFFNFNGLFSYFWFQVWTLFLFFCKGWAGVCFGLIDKVRALIRTKFLCLLLW